EAKRLADVVNAHARALIGDRAGLERFVRGQELRIPPAPQQLGVLVHVRRFVPAPGGRVEEAEARVDGDREDPGREIRRGRSPAPGAAPPRGGGRRRGVVGTRKGGVVAPSTRGPTACPPHPQAFMAMNTTGRATAASGST